MTLIAICVCLSLSRLLTSAWDLHCQLWYDIFSLMKHLCTAGDERRNIGTSLMLAQSDCGLYVKMHSGWYVFVLIKSAFCCLVSTHVALLACLCSTGAELLWLPPQVPAAARAGAIAPCEVTVFGQNTGLGPEKTSFFQALGITTKISRGTIEILVSMHIRVALLYLRCHWDVAQKQALPFMLILH